MADKATTPIAGQLLRAPAMCQGTARSVLPSVAQYASSQNLLADSASWPFSKFHQRVKLGAYMYRLIWTKYF